MPRSPTQSQPLHWQKFCMYFHSLTDTDKEINTHTHTHTHTHTAKGQGARLHTMYSCTLSQTGMKGQPQLLATLPRAKSPVLIQHEAGWPPAPVSILCKS